MKQLRFFVLLSLTAALLLAVVLAIPAAAEEPQSQERQIHVGNWESACFVDGELYILRMGRDQDRELSFAVRAFCEALGYQVAWDGAQGAITLTRGGDEIRVLVGQRHCLVNGSRLYLRKPVQIDEFGSAYLPLCFAETALGLELTGTNFAPAPSNRIYDVTLETAVQDYDAQQRLCWEGEQPWRADPVAVVEDFAGKLGFAGTGALAGAVADYDETTRVRYTRDDGLVLQLDLYKPAAKDGSGIWAVSHWYNADNTLYHARDLSKLQPLFHHVDSLTDQQHGVLRGVVADAFTRAYSPHYKVLGMEATGLHHTAQNGLLVAEWQMTLVTRNFPRQPEDIAWIRAVKEQGGRDYLALYEDYLLAIQSNYSLRAEGALDEFGNLAAESIRLYAHNGEQGYVPLEEMFPRG